MLRRVLQAWIYNDLIKKQNAQLDDNYLNNSMTSHVAVMVIESIPINMR